VLAHAAARGVAHGANRGARIEHGVPPARFSGAESLRTSVSSCSPFALAKNRDAVVSDTAAQNHRVARARAGSGKRHPLAHQPDAVVVMYTPVAAAAFQPPSVSPVTICTPAACARSFMDSTIRRQRLHGEALFRMKAALR